MFARLPIDIDASLLFPLFMDLLAGVVLMVGGGVVARRRAAAIRRSSPEPLERAALPTQFIINQRKRS